MNRDRLASSSGIGLGSNSGLKRGNAVEKKYVGRRLK
jgi:hypothetical protein